MSYQLQVIKDNPIAFWPLDESSGTTAFDISGSGNNGTYHGSITTNILPLVSGGVSGSLITSEDYITLPILYDYNGDDASGGLANKYYSDNDFSLECWIYPKFISTSISPIFADNANSTIGIYWQDGNIVFLAGDKRLDYRTNNVDQSMHIVATYTPTSMSLYINGVKEETKSFTKNIFTNDEFYPFIGPTYEASDSFIADAPAIYRYALSESQVKNHFNLFKPIAPIQIVGPDNGILFSMSDESIKKTFSYCYPYNKKWDQFNVSGLYYDKKEDFISVDTDLNSVILEDRFTIPSSINLVSSKVEWVGTKGVTVEISLDGVTYTECTNGYAIPNYVLGSSFSSSKLIYVRITLLSEDITYYFPKLYSLNFNFYSSKTLFADNHGEDIEPESSNLTTWDYDLGSIDHSILTRNKNNGIRPYDSGFPLNTLMDVLSIEMFFTPATLAANYLFYNDLASLSWNGAGAITKSGISAIYVNGVNRTAATNISSFFQVDELHHIVIVLSSSISDQIWFNVKVTNGTWSNSGPRNLYKNIAIYPSALTSTIASEHFALYTERSSASADNPVISITEDAYTVHDYDWIVVKSV